MLVIRRSQLHTLTLTPEMLDYEHRLIAHLWSVWPRECRLAGGDDHMTAVVRPIIWKAQRNGYHTERELTLYALMVFSLGIGFDTDPQFVWAAESLLNEGVEDATQRIELVYDEMVDYLGQVGGEEGERVLPALLRARRFDIAGAPASEGEAQVEDLCDLLDTIWPEKFAFQELAPTVAMVRASLAKAGRYGIVEPAGRWAFATVAFIFGHDFDVDPLHPWATAALADPATPDGAARGMRLYEAGMDRLAQSLDQEPADVAELVV